MGKKLLAMLLGLTLTFGILTGCGETDNGGKSSEVASGSEVVSSTDVASSSESKQNNKKDEKPVSLRLVMFGSVGERNSSFWDNEFHDKVLEELNIDMEVDYLPWGSEDQIGTMLASGEKFAWFCAVTRGRFGGWASDGFFATIDEELVEEIAPAYIEARMNHGFEAAKYSDEIVVLPVGSTAYSGTLDNFVIRNDILNTVGWDVSKIKTYDDLVEAVKAVKAKYPDMEILYNMAHIGKGLESVYAPNGEIFQNASLTPVATVNLADPDSDEVISWFESEYFGDLCKILEDWYAMGFTEKDVLIDYTIYENAWQSGNCLMGAGAIDRIYKHDGLNNYSGDEVDIQYLALDNGPLVIEKDYDWGWSISAADQENVEHYLRFFNWMYENEENYKFCLYGVEGTDYTVTDTGAIEKLTKDAFFPTWMHGTFKYEPPSSADYDEEEINEYMNLDSSAIISKKAGFVFDTSAVEVETAAINAIVSEKVKPIAYGFGDYEKDFPAILAELKAAGLDKYMEEYQRQFTAFMATK